MSERPIWTQGGSIRDFSPNGADQLNDQISII